MTLDRISHGARVYCLYESGLGDTLLNYKRIGAATSYVMPLWRARPDLRFYAVVCSHCENAPRLFDHNPFFHEVLTIPYRRDLDVMRREVTADGVNLEHVMGDLGLVPEEMPFFLTHQEEDILAPLLLRPYVLVHPWSSNRRHSWFLRIGAAGLDRVVNIILEAGFDVAVTGASYVKNETGRNEKMEEGYQKPQDAPPGRFHDLMGASVALTGEAVRRASCVVGGVSAFVSLAGEFGKPCWLGVSEDMRGDFAREGDIFARFVKQGASVNWWTRRDTLEEELVTLKDFLWRHNS